MKSKIAVSLLLFFVGWSIYSYHQPVQTSPSQIVQVPLPRATANNLEPTSTPLATLLPSVYQPTNTINPTPVPTLISTSSRCNSVNGLPDPNCTPGVADPRVTQDNIQQTICVSGYTKTVRPSSSYTTQLKIQQIKEYGYLDTNTSDYEEDHLIPLEVGGSPTDPKNLWPELGSIPNPKDKIENLCHDKVCNGQISLAEAQREIATNWYTACGGTSNNQIQVITPTQAPVVAPPAQTNTIPADNGATALCNDGTYSYAAHHQGACSHHGGVNIFYK